MSEEGEQSIDMQLDGYWGSHDVFATYTSPNWDGDSGTYSPWEGASEEDWEYESSRRSKDVSWILYAIIIILPTCWAIYATLTYIFDKFAQTYREAFNWETIIFIKTFL